MILALLPEERLLVYTNSALIYLSREVSEKIYRISDYS